MIRRGLVVLAAVAGLATAPAVAQQTQAGSPQPGPASAAPAGPRLDPGFKSFKPKFAQEQQSLAAAAAADRTVITISTLGLVLLIILLIVLIA
jgi:hypothetical protein